MADAGADAGNRPVSGAVQAVLENSLVGFLRLHDVFSFLFWLLWLFSLCITLVVSGGGGGA